VWKANREAANATMIDSDNVLLLRVGAQLGNGVHADRTPSRVRERRAAKGLTPNR
jgi:hypothetical protein